MHFLREKLRASPIHARVVPFVVLVAPLFIQDSFGEDLRYWVYLGRMVLSGWCLWQIRDLVPEMRWNFSWEGAVAGVLVLALWVGLDPFYPKSSLLFHLGDPWNPFKHFGSGSVLGWFFFFVRTLGSAIVIPPIEEIFYRSFLYRYLVKLKFTDMPLSKFHPLSFFVTSALFGLEHFQWLAGILCGLIFQFLVVKKGRLGDAIFAHGVTNFLLGIWIYWRNDWQFW
jgi:CAAX prenyl protease-like protein